MNPVLFIITICSFLFSLVAGIVVSFFTAHIPARLINTLVIFHLLCLLFYGILWHQPVGVEQPGNLNYLFLAFFCSGILITPSVLRGERPLFMRIYFGLYLLSIPFFVLVPSRFLGFVASGNPAAVTPVRYHLLDNLYLVQANVTGVAESYKLVRESGMFHKTLAREIRLPDGIDSVKLIHLQQDSLVSLRVFMNHQPGDSMDVNIAFMKKNSTILKNR